MGFLNPPFNRLARLDDLHVVRGFHLKQDSGLTVQCRQYLVLLEPVDHRRDVHDSHLATIRRLPNHNLLKIRLGIGEILSSQLHVACLSAHLAYGNIHGVATDRGRDISEAQSVVAEIPLGELNRDLLTPRAEHLHLRDVGQTRKLIPELIRQSGQCFLPDITR